MEKLYLNMEENFSNWFDKFYDETLVDRELYFMYMEEKNRYVQY